MTLNKAFWDSLEKSCPKEVKAFKAWLTEYAEEIDWHTLFDDPFTPFHDLPDAMQFGVYIQYGFETEGPVYIGEFEEIHESIRKTFHEREQNNNT